MKYKRPKHSTKGRLINEIGKIHLQILKIKRNGPRCEICGRIGNVGRFHILSVARHPRLRFVDENVLITCWLPCHYLWHHAGPNDPRCIRIMERIIELRGPDYEERLLDREQYIGKHDELYLRCLKESMTKELEALNAKI